MTGVIYSDDGDSDCLAALRFELGNLAVEIVNYAINLPDHCFLYDLYLDPNFNSGDRSALNSETRFYNRSDMGNDLTKGAPRRALTP